MSGKKSLKEYFLEIVRLEEDASAGATSVGGIAASTAVGQSERSSNSPKSRKSSPTRRRRRKGVLDDVEKPTIRRL
jgi:hypothetical protein